MFLDRSSEQTKQTKISLLLKKQSDQDLQCLPENQKLLEIILCCEITIGYISDIPYYSNFLGVSETLTVLW